MRKSLVSAGLVAVMAAAPRSSLADAIVLESHVGPRSSDAQKLLKPLRAALQKRGFVVEQQPLTQILGAHLTSSSMKQPQVTAQALSTAFTLANGNWLNGDIKRATTRLTEVIQAALAAPSLLAKEPQLRDALFSSLISLAQAHKRQGQLRESEEAMAELIRSFPEREVTRDASGPEAHGLYSVVRRDLEMQGYGRLEIGVDVPCVIYLDEMPRKQSGKGAQIERLLAGDYRVVVQTTQTPVQTRTYRVRVAPQETTRLDIDWALDSALVLDDWVGLQFDSSPQQAKEGDLALRLARRTDSSTVVTVRFEAQSRRLTKVQAWLYDLKWNKQTCGALIRLSGRANDATYYNGLADTLATCISPPNSQTAQAKPPRQGTPATD